jgi:hypothetical protein
MEEVRAQSARAQPSDEGEQLIEIAIARERARL